MVVHQILEHKIFSEGAEEAELFSSKNDIISAA